MVVRLHVEKVSVLCGLMHKLNFFDHSLSSHDKLCMMMSLHKMDCVMK